MLCTKLGAACDRQATVVGRLLTTLGDDRRAVAKLFSVQRLGITLIFGDIRISYLFDILQLQGALSPDQKLWIM